MWWLVSSSSSSSSSSIPWMVIQYIYIYGMKNRTMRVCVWSVIHTVECGGCKIHSLIFVCVCVGSFSADVSL